MKKALILLFAVFSYTVVHAQLSIVPKAGFTYYTAILGEDVFDAEIMFKPGFLVGVGVDITISDFFSIKPEVVYIQKGWKVEDTDDDPDYGYIENTDISLNYIELPVMFKFTFGERTKFLLNAGPYVGLGLNGKAKWDYTQFYGGVPDYMESGETNIKFGERPQNSQSDDEYIDNALEFGGQAGLGVIIINRILIEARCSASMTNLLDADSNEDTTSKNVGVQFIIAVPIGLN